LGFKKKRFFNPILNQLKHPDSHYNLGLWHTTKFCAQHGAVWLAWNESSCAVWSYFSFQSH